MPLRRSYPRLWLGVHGVGPSDPPAASAKDSPIAIWNHMDVCEKIATLLMKKISVQRVSVWSFDFVSKMKSVLKIRSKTFFCCLPHGNPHAQTRLPLFTNRSLTLYKPCICERSLFPQHDYFNNVARHEVCTVRDLRPGSPFSSRSRRAQLWRSAFKMGFDRID